MPNSQLLLNWEAPSEQPKPGEARDHAGQTGARRNSTDVQKCERAAVLDVPKVPLYRPFVTKSALQSLRPLRAKSCRAYASVRSRTHAIVALDTKLHVRRRMGKKHDLPFNYFNLSLLCA